MLSRIGAIQTPLPAPVALLIGILAAIVVHGPTLFKITNHAETVVHEGAHALVGLATGRRIRSVRINSDGGGGTAIVPASGFGFGLAASVGYIGASGAGLIAAWLISIGRIVVMLWLGLLLLAVMLLMVRNFFGGIVTLSCGLLLFLIVRYTTAGVETAVAYGVTWFLLLAAPKIALGAARKPKDVTDARILAGMTFLWPAAWCFLWVIGTIAALVVGGAILVLSMPRAPNPLRQARFFCGKSHSTGGSLGLEQRGEMVPAAVEGKTWKGLKEHTKRLEPGKSPLRIRIRTGHPPNPVQCRPRPDQNPARARPGPGADLRLADRREARD